MSAHLGGNTALIAIGANLPFEKRGPERTVVVAMERLEEATGARPFCSRLWSTPAFPAGSGPDYVNAAAALPWDRGADALLTLLHGIEGALGRKRAGRWEARIIDLDLIALGDEIRPDRAGFEAWFRLPPEEAARKTPEQLILPHPRLHERGFVLAPLEEVAPEWRHPVLGLTVREMRASLPPAALDGVWPIGPATLFDRGGVR